MSWRAAEDDGDGRANLSQQVPRQSHDVGHTTLQHHIQIGVCPISGVRLRYLVRITTENTKLRREGGIITFLHGTNEKYPWYSSKTNERDRATTKKKTE